LPRFVPRDYLSDEFRDHVRSVRWTRSNRAGVRLRVVAANVGYPHYMPLNKMVLSGEVRVSPLNVERLARLKDLLGFTGNVLKSGAL
jgi:hypothetical protein